MDDVGTMHNLKKPKPKKVKKLFKRFKSYRVYVVLALSVALLLSIHFYFVPTATTETQKQQKERINKLKPSSQASKTSLASLDTPRQKWTPKKRARLATNKYLFNAIAFPWIVKAECGPFKPPCCHANPKDPGGFTCVGISIRYNQDLIADIITRSYNEYERVTLPSISEVKYRYIFNSIPAKELIKTRYYDKYYTPFNNCPFIVAIKLLDSQVLSGQAARLFQRSQGLKVDNIWGPKTQAACQANPDMKAFDEARIARFKKLKHCDVYCTGWIKRLTQLNKWINKNSKEIKTYEKFTALYSNSRVQHYLYSTTF